MLPDGGEAQAPAEGVVAEGGQQGEQASANNGWFYSENVPGEGDAPEWFKGDKYGSVSDQAKAYSELAQRFGGFTGAPEEYKVQLDESVSDYIDPENPVVQDLMTAAREANMSQDTLNTFLNIYAKGEASLSQLAEEEAQQTAKAEMEKLGSNANERLDNIKSWAENNLAPEHYEALKDVVQTAGAVEAIEAMIKSTKNAPIPQNIPQGESITREKIDEMINAKNEHGQHKMSIDPDYRDKVQKMIRQFHGE